MSAPVLLLVLFAAFLAERLKAGRIAACVVIAAGAALIGHA